MADDEEQGNIGTLVADRANGASPMAEEASASPELIEEGEQPPEELEPLSAVIERYGQHETRRADVDDLRGRWREEDAEGIRLSLEEPLAVITQRKDASVALQKKLDFSNALLVELVDAVKADPEQWQSYVRRNPPVAEALQALAESQQHGGAERLNERQAKWIEEQEPQVRQATSLALYKQLLVGDLKPLFRDLEAGKFKTVADVGQAIFAAGVSQGLKDGGKVTTAQEKVEARRGQGADTGQHRTGAGGTAYGTQREVESLYLAGKASAAQVREARGTLPY